MPTPSENNHLVSFTGWQREKEFLEKEKEAHPELFTREPIIDDAETLKRVGIDAEIFGDHPLGHIKLFPEDFVVEEVSRDGTLHTIDDEPASRGNFPSAEEEIRTVWADVVKMGLDTIEVVNELSRLLNLEKKFIGFAGIKDKHALTAQQISLRGVHPEALAKISAPNFFIKNITLGKGALQTGDLQGNRFTIFIRTASPIARMQFEEKLKTIEEDGFWNFFYLQRFGTPRLISHKLGLLILQGKFEDAIRVFLTYGRDRELPYFVEIRRRLNASWRNWREMLLTLNPLPHTFRNEKVVLEYLERFPKDFTDALNQIPEQVRLWVYAYGSYLFNTALSDLIRTGEDVPFSLPVAFSKSPRAGEFYDAFFKEHGIERPFPALKYFPYVQRPEKDVEVLKQVMVHGWDTTAEGIALDFFLEKATYATTFLAHLFTLSSGQPLPEGISVREVDIKSMLGKGSLVPLRERFKEMFEMREQ